MQSSGCKDIQLLVQKSQVGSIIGRAGFKIKDIREVTQADQSIQKWIYCVTVIHVKPVNGISTHPNCLLKLEISSANHLW